MNSLSRFGCGAALVLTAGGASFAQTSDSISELLQAHQLDLATNGQAFLLTCCPSSLRLVPRVEARLAG